MIEISDLEQIYSEEYHKTGLRGEKQYPAKQDMAAGLDTIIAWSAGFRARSVVDVGCGRGWWLEYWATHRPDVEILGLDGCADLIVRTGSCHEVLKGAIYPCDLRRPGWQTPWWRPGGWDLVLCAEVAEHLEEEHAAGLVDGLCDLGPTIFFSPARPGQKGVHHVNCQPAHYWIEMFEARGYELRMDLRREWCGQLRFRGTRVCKNIRRNALFFTKQKGE